MVTKPETVLLNNIKHLEAEEILERLEHEFDTVPLAPMHAKTNRKMAQHMRNILEYYNA